METILIITIMVADFFMKQVKLKTAIHNNIKPHSNFSFPISQGKLVNFYDINSQNNEVYSTTY